MKRLLTLGSAGLLATGLAIFPVSVFAQPNAATAAAQPDAAHVSAQPNAAHAPAQPNAATGADKKAPAVASVAGHDTKSIAAGKQASSKEAVKPTPASKDAAKATTAKAGSAKAATSPVPGSAPTGNPAKVGG